MLQVMTNPIEHLRNLGSKTGKLFRDVGVTTVEDLRKIGPVEAYYRLKTLSPQNVSLNALWAIQAGLLDIDWRQLPTEIKSKLRMAVEKKSR